MGEELELDRLYIKVGDGGYVPFNGITEVELTDDSDAVYDPIVPITNEPMTITFDMKRRDHKKILKFFKAQANNYGRRVRRYKRNKENARRALLKAGYKLDKGYLIPMR